MRARLIKFFILIIGLFLIVNLIRSVASVSDKGQIIMDAEKRLVEEQEKSSKLKRNLVKIQSLPYIEKEAREKLNLGRDGEYTIILPPITPFSTPIPIESVSNWEAWIQAFWP